jgi:hypothetical protein
MERHTPEHISTNESELTYEKAVRLYEISCKAGDILGDYLAKHEDLLKATAHPELATIASQIVGTVFEQTCDLLQISRDIRVEVSDNKEI